MPTLTRTLATLAAVSLVSTAMPAQNPPATPQSAAPMTFFITSAGKGDGANLGGLDGADGRPIHARDRIGAGPWHNARGALIANTVADLHGDIIRDRNQMNKVNALTEKGQPVNGVGDTPNQHDIVTGSDSFGRAVPGTFDTTCSNWTSNAATGSAMVGHHDRTGGGNTSWNSAHPSRGCGQANLAATGGAGLFYCFGAN